MGTLEATVSMMEKCTEDELNVVQQVVRQFIISKEHTELEKEQFIDELKTARNQHKTGEGTEARQALNEMNIQYGL